jgi:hypothetical protein
MPTILYGASWLLENVDKQLLDLLSWWLNDMEQEGLLTLQRNQAQLSIRSASGATVTIEKHDDWFDMSRTLLGMRFSLRIQDSPCGFVIADRHGMKQILEPEAFYGELKEMLRPQA